MTFDYKFFARTSPNFDIKDTSNAVGVLRTGDNAIVVQKTKTPGGNWGLKVKLTNGPKKGKSYWVYYDKSNPGMNLVENGKRVTPDGRESKAAHKPPINKVQTPSADSGSTYLSNKSESGSCINCSENTAERSAESSIAKVRGMIGNIYPSAFKGALKTMAVLYQSCSVLDKKPYPLSRDASIDKFLTYKSASSSLGHSYKVRSIPTGNLSQLVNSHYYLKDLEVPKNKLCKDMRALPPIYTYGGKPKVTKSEINLLVEQKTSGAKFSGLDCSTFISTALTAAGLRIKPGQPIQENRATSTQLSNFTEKNSCFSSPTMTADTTIQPGDIIAFSGHTFMIDTVGKDPFGLDKMKIRGGRIKSKQDCYNLPDDAEENFDFRIIQSAGLGSLAVSRTEASTYISKSNLMRYVEPFMISACIAKVTGQKMTSPKNLRTALLRHRGSEVPGCLIPKNQMPHMTGEECVASCTN